MTQITNRLAAIACGLVLTATGANASGFALQEQSVSGLGNAFAGGAAAAEDNSVIFTNPAALTLLDSAELQLGLHYIGTEAEMKNAGTTTLGVPTQGADQSSEESAVVPNMYYSQPISEDLVLGLGITIPVGLATEWGSDWYGRYIADYSELRDINIQPTLAYKVNDKWSLGFGLNVANVEAELTNAVDMGLVFLNALQGGAIPAGAVSATLIGDVQANIGASKYDGFFRVKGDGIGYGYNVGVLYQPTEATRIGFHYRSSIEVELEGDVTFDVGPLAQIIGASFPNGGGMVDLELPSLMNLSVHHQINDQWSIMGDLQRTGWSSFETLEIQFDQPSPPNSVVPENWDDVWRVSGGVSYQVSEDLKLRGGMAWDQSPVPDPEHRSPRIPDADRVWFSGGFEYQMTDNFRLNGGATYIVVDDVTVDNSDHAAGFHMKANMEASVVIVSFSGVLSF